MGWVIDPKVIRKVFTVGPPPPSRLSRNQAGTLSKTVLRSVHNMADISGPSAQRTKQRCRTVAWAPVLSPWGGGARTFIQIHLSLTLRLKCVFVCVCFPAWVKVWLALPGWNQEHFCEEMFEGLTFLTYRCLAHSSLSPVLLTKTEACQTGMRFPWLREYYNAHKSVLFNLKMRRCAGPV